MRSFFFFCKDPLIFLISLLFFYAWSLFFPLISTISLFGIMSMCLSGKDLWFLKLCLGTHLLCSCCNCPFGAMSLACSPLTSSLFFAPSSLPSLYNLLMNPTHIQQTFYLQNCLLLSWFVFLSTVMQLFQYRFAKKWKQSCSAFFGCPKCSPFVFWLAENIWEQMLALQSHVCFGWKLTTGLSFSMSAPLPFTQHPQHTRSQARGFTLTDNGCVQLQGISNRVLS